jgi:hypothetical protein
MFSLFEGKAEIVQCQRTPERVLGAVLAERGKRKIGEDQLLLIRRGPLITRGAIDH